MCGICGIVALDTMCSIPEAVVQRMCDVIEHRGPDDEGFWINRHVGLGMRRLSIVDLQGGHQPIFNERETICVILNGEIYNHLELRVSLEKLGHRFRSQSDTEAIVHAYEEWGEDCPAKLSGMFAFAIWDQEKQLLFVARDRLGQKPLYYYVDEKRFVFASEIKSILEYEGGLRHIDPYALSSFLTLGYVPAPHTMFDKISKLPAGHSLSVLGGCYQVREYWDVRYDRVQPRSVAGYCERLCHLLEDSVRARLMSDVPLGAFLSGGIDSSIIVSLMSQIMNRPVDTFSVGFEEENLNELPYARIAAQHFGTNHHEIGVNSCSPDLLKRLVWHLDEPVADPAAVPTYLVSELARRDVTVALTGEGGDELFAGYDYYRMDGWAQRRQILPSALSRRVLPALAGSVNTVLGRQRYHDRTIWHWSLPPEEQMVAWVAIFTADETNRLLSPAFRQYMQDYDSSQAFARYYSKCSARDRLHRLMYIDSKVWLPDDLLMKVDKMSMACSLEARSPFLDHKLVEFVSTIPSDMKLHGSDSKYVLKQVARQILPDEIVNRPKHTFDVPIGKWLRTDLRDLAREIVADGVIEGEDILNTEYVFGEMWRGLEGEQPGYARQFWSLVNLGLWARRFRMRLA